MTLGMIIAARNIKENAFLEFNIGKLNSDYTNTCWQAALKMCVSGVILTTYPALAGSTCYSE